MGISRLWLEMDCMELTKLWDTLDAQRSPIRLILLEAKELSRSFDDFKFSYVNRSCNKVAYTCARQVSREHTRVEWQQNSPGSPHQLIELDCNHPHRD